MIYQHKLTIYLFLIELILIPIINLIASVLLPQHLGKVSFLYRFGYIALFLNATIFLFNIKKIKNNLLSFIFLISILIGLFKGSIDGVIFNVGRWGYPIAFSNIFSLLMPFTMINYGYYFFESYLKNKALRQLLNQIFKYSFFTGLFVVLMFNLLRSFGLYWRDSIDIWNFFYSGPYLLTNIPSGGIYLIVSLLLTIGTAKRVSIFTLSIMVIWITSVLLRRKRLKISFLNLTFTGVFLSLSLFFFRTSFKRFEYMFNLVALGDLDGATSGRIEEALSAINYLFSNVANIIFGAGFGATYLPMLNNIRPYLSSFTYEYTVHYSHFTPISYIWLGGILLSLSIYIFLIRLLISLSIKFYKSIIPLEYIFIPAYILGIIVNSFSGSVLFNNTFLWLIIGSAYKLNEKRFLE